MPILRCVCCGHRLVPTGRSLHCACGAVWVTELVLVDMIGQGLRVALPWQSRKAAARPCPMCERPMRPVRLHGVRADRCSDHGAWFDPGKLERVLRRRTAPQFGVPVPVEHDDTPDPR